MLLIFLMFALIAYVIVRIAKTQKPNSASRQKSEAGFIVLRCAVD